MVSVSTDLPENALPSFASFGDRTVDSRAALRLELTGLVGMSFCSVMTCPSHDGLSSSAWMVLGEMLSRWPL